MWCIPDSASTSGSTLSPEHLLQRLRQKALLSLSPAAVTSALQFRTGHGVLVAVVDSGWDSALSDRRVAPGVTVDLDQELAGCTHAVAGADDQLGHGTECTDAILGIAPDVSVLPVRVFDDRLECGPSRLAMAIDIARDSGARIINMSLGTTDPRAVRILYRACEAAAESGCVLVSAGSRDTRCYPAAFDLVIGVDVARFANPFRFYCTAADGTGIAADGVRRIVRSRGGSLRMRSGSSIAAATVSGMLALRLEGCGSDSRRAALAFLRECGESPSAELLASRS